MPGPKGVPRADIVALRRYAHLRGTTRTETARRAADLYGQGCTRALLLEAGVRLRGRGGTLL